MNDDQCGQDQLVGCLLIAITALAVVLFLVMVTR